MDKAKIVRLIVFVITIVNTVATFAGVPPIPVDQATAEYIAALLVALAGWWTAAKGDFSKKKNK